MTDIEPIPHDPTHPTEGVAATAYRAEQRIKGLIRVMNAAWTELAESLYQFSQQELWRDLGYNTFGEWCATPEIGIGRRQAYYYLEIWRELIVNRDVDPGDLKRADQTKWTEVLPAVRRGNVTVEEAISDAESLPREDLRLKYAEIGSGPEKGLDALREPAWVVCPTCGSSYRA